MKNLLPLAAFLALPLCVNAQSADDPVIMEIGGKEIKRSEFEYIYNKNNSASTVEKKELDEYIDMFVNFKLKVLEAESEGIDTTKNFINEFRGYRSQLAIGYLTDKDADEQNVKAIYERLKEDVRASHILISCTEDALPEDTLKAYNRAMEVYNLLNEGADFTYTANQYSDDPSAKYNGGDLGYFTALQMVPTFEEAVYALQPGEISMPVRSRFGYHVIKLTDRRPCRGKVRVAHIFKQINQDASDSVFAATKEFMDSIYKALESGSDFAELARKYSDDQVSAQRGGELGWIRMKQTIPAFEEKIFTMNNGETSEPFITPVGIHIVKKFEHIRLEPFEEKRNEIITTLNRMGANDKGQKALIERLKKEYQFSGINQETCKMLLETAPEATLADSTYMAALDGRDDKLFILDGKSYGVQSFLEFVIANPRMNKAPREVSLHKLIDLYVNKTVLDCEDSKLEDKHAEFALLVNEYRDGILLFEISNREVWNKAATDEEGLEKFFKKHKRNYKWEKPHFKGIIVHCVSDSLQNPIKELLKSCQYDEWTEELKKAYMSDSVKLVKVDKGLFAQGDNKYVDFLEFNGPEFEQPEGFAHTFAVGKVLKKPESYKDVKGPVSSDYQNYLEEEWIKYLRKKYASQIIIHDDVVKTVNNH